MVGGKRTVTHILQQKNPEIGFSQLNPLKRQKTENPLVIGAILDRKSIFDTQNSFLHSLRGNDFKVPKFLPITKQLKPMNSLQPKLRALLGADSIDPIEIPNYDFIRRRSKSINESSPRNSRNVDSFPLALNRMSTLPLIEKFQEDAVSLHTADHAARCVPARSDALSINSPDPHQNRTNSQMRAAPDDSQKERRYKRKTQADALGKVSGRWTKAEHHKFLDGKLFLLFFSN